MPKTAGVALGYTRCVTPRTIDAAKWYRVNVKTSDPLASPTPTRRRPTATGTLVGTRFQSEMLEAIDAWRKLQVDLPTRPEAVRRLVELGMAADTSLRQPVGPNGKVNT